MSERRTTYLKNYSIQGVEFKKQGPIWISQNFGVPEFFDYKKPGVLFTDQEPFVWILNNPSLFPGDLIPENAERKTTLTQILYVILKSQILFKEHTGLTSLQAIDINNRLLKLQEIMKNMGLFSENYVKPKQLHDFYQVGFRICRYLERFPYIYDYLQNSWFGTQNIAPYFYPTGEPILANCEATKPRTYGAYREKIEGDRIQIHAEDGVLFPIVLQLLADSPIKSSSY